jgi:ribosome-binding protein aMBF1 (putative translation factor)
VTEPTRPALDGAGLRAIKAEIDDGRRDLWHAWERAVRDAAEAGMSERQLAEELGVQRLTVRRWLGRA